MAAVSAVTSNLKTVGSIIGSVNAVGFLISAGFETHKITDLCGVGAFVAAAAGLTVTNEALAKNKLATIGIGKLPLISKILKTSALSIPKFTLGTARVFLANVGVIMWGSRLASYLFHRVLKLGEDKRLDSFYRQPGEGYFDTKGAFYPVKLAGFWTIQAAWGFLCMLPVTFLNSVPASSGLLSLKWNGPLTAGEHSAGDVIHCTCPCSVYTPAITINRHVPLAFAST
jgi:Protein of unknown function (DUF1295)